MHVIKDKLDHIKEKFAKIVQIFLSNGSDPDLDLVQLFRIQYNYSGSGTDLAEKFQIRIHNTVLRVIL
jgi:hypothetical protein